MFYIDNYTKSKKCFSIYKTIGKKSKKQQAFQKKLLKQRRERGFDDTELWNLDYSIISFVLPRLIAFKKMKRNGFPCSVSLKVEKKLGFRKSRKEVLDLTKEQHELVEVESIKLWDEILDSMIRAFYYLIEEFEYAEKSISKTVYDEKKDLQELLSTETRSEKVKDREYTRLEKNTKEIKKGLKYFSKYFCSLWD